MRRISIVALLAMVCLQAQDNPMVRRVFQLRYADADRVARMLIGAEHLSVDGAIKAIAIEAPKTKMDEFEEIIKRFDVPPPPVPNIEVTIYLMSALGQPAPTPVPPELEGVVKQLRSMFSYKGYQLIDAQVIRVRAGHGGDTSAVIDSGSKEEIKTISQIKFRSASASTDEKGRAIRI